MSDPKKKGRVEVAKCLQNVKFANPGDEQARKVLPNLYDLLCPRWKDGALVRQPGRLTIRVEGGAYHLVIECPTEGVQTTVVVHSLTTALSDFEEVVKANVCNWGPTWQKKKKYLPTVDDVVE